MTRAARGVSSRAVLRVFPEPWFEPRPIRFSLDDQVVCITGDVIDGALRADRVGKGGEPFVRSAIRGDDDGAGAIALEEKVIEIATLDGVEDVDGEIIEDEQVDRDSLRSSAS